MTTLIARRGYSDTGSLISAVRSSAVRTVHRNLSNEQVAELGNYVPAGDDPTAANACNPQTQYWDGSKCVPFTPGSTTPAPDSGGFWSGLASMFGAGASAYTSSQNAAAAQAAAAAASANQNQWIVPVAVIGGLGILAIALTKRPRPATNPSRRRRRRARRRR
jgi:hypothetical protein